MALLTRNIKKAGETGRRVDRDLCEPLKLMFLAPG
jgi:hypothetical protein